jgi:hypothetical protein
MNAGRVGELTEHAQDRGEGQKSFVVRSRLHKLPRILAR